MTRVPVCPFPAPQVLPTAPLSLPQPSARLSALPPALLVGGLVRKASIFQPPALTFFSPHGVLFQTWNSGHMDQTGWQSIPLEEMLCVLPGPLTSRPSPAGPTPWWLCVWASRSLSPYVPAWLPPWASPVPRVSVLPQARVCWGLNTFCHALPHACWTYGISKVCLWGRGCCGRQISPNSSHGAEILHRGTMQDHLTYHRTSLVDPIIKEHHEARVWRKEPQKDVPIYCSPPCPPSMNTNMKALRQKGSCLRSYATRWDK